MDVHGQFGVLTGRPERVVALVVVGREPLARNGRDDDALHSAFGSPADLVTRGLEVVHGQHCERGPASRKIVREVGEPTIVGAIADPTQFVLGRLAETSKGHATVREENFGHDALALEHLRADRRVPLTVARVTALFVEGKAALVREEGGPFLLGVRLLRLLCPEPAHELLVLLPVGRVDVGHVVLRASGRMAVARDDHGSSLAHGRPPLRIPRKTTSGPKEPPRRAASLW
ncbi:MAG: hypothetical protein JRG95_00790 [Deltaproteobacteria bacterium]|nr:hypothetical protein [Deltaproteobacteria bacterium]